MERILTHSCGLSRNEARVYLALVREGSCKAGKVAKTAEIDRTSAYNSLKLLLEKGLASYVTIGKVKRFQASDPKNLRNYLQGRLEEVSEAVPILEKEYAATKLQSNVRLYKGTKGIKTVLGMVLNQNGKNRVFGSESQLDSTLPAFAAQFKAQLERKKIRTRNLVRKGRAVAETRLRKVRFVAQKTESPVVTNIFGNKILIIIWSNPPEAILVDNSSAAAAYRGYFDFMWGHAEKKKRG